MKNQKGNISILIVVLLISALLGAWYFFKWVKPAQPPVEMDSMEKMEVIEEMEKMEETEDTPEAMNNEVMDELDSLMMEIDSTSNEDLSDLDL